MGQKGGHNVQLMFFRLASSDPKFQFLPLCRPPYPTSTGLIVVLYLFLINFYAFMSKSIRSCEHLDVFTPAGDRKLVGDVSFVLSHGESMLLMGPSGLKVICVIAQEFSRFNLNDHFEC